MNYLHVKLSLSDDLQDILLNLCMYGHRCVREPRHNQSYLYMRNRSAGSWHKRGMEQGDIDKVRETETEREWQTRTWDSRSRILAAEIIIFQYGRQLQSKINFKKCQLSDFLRPGRQLVNAKWIRTPYSNVDIFLRY